MNSFTIKKVIVIYKESSFLFFLLFSHLAWSQSDLHSYCFERNVNLDEAKNTLSFILLPRDIVELRAGDNCIDIVTTPDRGKLFEKFLSKRYDLLPDSRTTYEVRTCRLDLKTTKQKNLESTDVSIGSRTAAKKSESQEINSTTMQILLSENQPGELEVSPQRLKVVCRLLNNDAANITFGFFEKDKAGLSSEAIVKKNDWLNIGSVIEDLNAKGKTLGIPETSWKTSTGKIETKYELQLK